MDRAELERLARECLARIPMPPADWAELVPQIERMCAIVAELEGFPFDDAEPAPTFAPDRGAPEGAAPPELSR